MKTKKRQDYLPSLYNGVRARCYNSWTPTYKYYGARGICMFNQWVDNKELFMSWILDNLGERPTPKHSLDRIDNDGNYEPGNLRWATPTEQANNKRWSSGLVLYKNEVMTQSECARRIGVSRQAIHQKKNNQYGNDDGIIFLGRKIAS